jgi:hypothetical protein
LAIALQSTLADPQKYGYLPTPIPQYPFFAELWSPLIVASVQSRPAKVRAEKINAKYCAGAALDYITVIISRA